MPLSEQLKSDMTGVPTEPTYRKVAEKPAADTLETSKSKTDGKSVTEDESGRSSVPLDSEPKELELLKSIDVQLKALSQSVLDLKKGISEGLGKDFSTVIEKVESARTRLDALLAPDTVSVAEETAAETLSIPMMLRTIVAKLEKNDRQLAQTLRENATFQIQVRQGMQQDLDSVREQLSGEQFNPLLREIASVYVEYQSLLADESIVGILRKNLQALFEQLEDILCDYGAEICRSEVGSVRQTRTCKVIGKIATADKEKHNTIAASKKPGVVRERTVLYPEFVDVYVYDSSLIVSDQINDENDGAKLTLESSINVEQSQLNDEPNGETQIEETDSEKN